MTAEHALARLASPACYPHAPASVHLVQTHLSVVCLTGEFVYKLKKAVTLPFVDFAPLGASHALLLGRYRIEGEVPSRGVFSLVLAQQDGRIVILHDHTTGTGQ